MLSLFVHAIPAVAPPTFPSSFYAGMQTFIALNKGGATFAPGGGACCSKTKSSKCGLQVINQGADTWQSGELQMHRQNNVVTNFTANFRVGETSGREMAVVPASQTTKYANSSHKWACAVYCPLQGEVYYDLIEIGTGKKHDAVTFEGNVTVTQREGPLALLRSRPLD